MSNIVRSLGLEFGHRVVHRTTFNDDGMVPANSPLRQTYAHWQPTIFGLLAGSLRLLRDPHVVYSLGHALAEANKNKKPGAPDRTLVDHLLDIYSSQLAVVFGDQATAEAVKKVLEIAHRQRFPAKEQPEWFIEAIGGLPRDFTIGEPQLKEAVVGALVSSVARAHQATGLLIDGQGGNRYVLGADLSLGWASEISLFPAGTSASSLTLQKLHQVTRSYAGVPLMDRELLTKAKVPKTLKTILDTEVTPGVPISAFTTQIVGLTLPEDREALGLAWTDIDQTAFDEWAADYAAKAERTNLAKGTPAATDDTDQLATDSYFEVARGRFW